MKKDKKRKSRSLRKSMMELLKKSLWKQFMRNLSLRKSETAPLLRHLLIFPRGKNLCSKTRDLMKGQELREIPVLIATTTGKTGKTGIKITEIIKITKKEKGKEEEIIVKATTKNNTARNTKRKTQKECTMTQVLIKSKNQEPSTRSKSKSWKRKVSQWQGNLQQTKRKSKTTTQPNST